MKETFDDIKIVKMASQYPEIKYKRIYEQVSYLKPHWRKNRTDAQFNELIKQMITQLRQEVKVTISLNNNVKFEDKIQTRAAKAAIQQHHQTQQQQGVKKTTTTKINVPVSPLVTSTTNHTEEHQFNIPTTENQNNAKISKPTVTLVLNMPRIMCDALHTNMISLDAGSNDDLVNIMTPRVRYLFDVQEQNELSSAINVLEQLHVKETTINEQKTNAKVPKKRGRPKNKKSNVITTTTQDTTTVINSDTHVVANSSLTTFYENIDWLVNSPYATPSSMVQVSSTTQNLTYTNADIQNQAAATYVVNFTNDGMQFTLSEGPLNFTTVNNNAIIQGNDTNLPNIWEPNTGMQLGEETHTFQPLTCEGPGPMLNSFGEAYVSPLDKAFKAAMSMPELTNETINNTNAASNENIETEKVDKNINEELSSNLYSILNKNINLEQNEEKINDNVWAGLLCNEDVIAFAAEAEAVNRNMELMADITEILDKSIANKALVEPEDGESAVEVKSNEIVAQTNFVEGTKIEMDQSCRPKNAKIEILDVTILQKGDTICNNNLRLDLTKKSNGIKADESMQTNKEENEKMANTCHPKPLDVVKSRESEEPILNDMAVAATDVEPKSENKKENIISNVKQINQNKQEKSTLIDEEGIVNESKAACPFISKPFEIRLRKLNFTRSNWRQIQMPKPLDNRKNDDIGQSIKIILKRNKANDSAEAVESAIWTVQPWQETLQQNVKTETDNEESQQNLQELKQVLHEPEQQQEPSQKPYPQQEKPQQQQLPPAQETQQQQPREPHQQKQQNPQPQLKPQQKQEPRQQQETHQQKPQQQQQAPKQMHNKLKEDKKYLKKDDIKQILDLEDELLDFEDDVLSLTASPIRDLEEFEEKNVEECNNNITKYEEENDFKKFKIPKLSQNTITTTAPATTTTTTQNMQWTQKLSTNTTFKNLLNDCSFEMPKRIKSDTLTMSASALSSTKNFMQDTSKYNNSLEPIFCNKVQQQQPAQLQQLGDCMSENKFNNIENIATKNNIPELVHLADVQNPIRKPCMNNNKFIIPEDFKIVKTIANDAAQHMDGQLNLNSHDIAETHTLKIAKLFGIDCWLYFIGECTVNNNCGSIHQMRSLEEVQLAISLLDGNDLERAYRFVLQYAKLYEMYICCFCKLWAQRKDVERLMYLSMDCQLYVHSVRTVFIEHICPALIQCGMQPVVICRELLKRLRRNPSNEMLTVLLNLIMECGQWTRFLPDIERLLSYSQLDMPLNIIYQMISASEEQPSNWEIRNLTFKCLLKLNLENLARIQSIPFILKFVQSLQQSA